MASKRGLAVRVLQLADALDKDGSSNRFHSTPPMSAYWPKDEDWSSSSSSFGKANLNGNVEEGNGDEEDQLVVEVSDEVVNNMSVKEDNHNAEKSPQLHQVTELVVNEEEESPCGAQEVDTLDQEYVGSSGADSSIIEDELEEEEILLFNHKPISKVTAASVQTMEQKTLVQSLEGQVEKKQVTDYVKGDAEVSFIMDSYQSRDVEKHDLYGSATLSTHKRKFEAEAPLQIAIASQGQVALDEDHNFKDMVRKKAPVDAQATVSMERDAQFNSDLSAQTNHYNTFGSVFESARPSDYVDDETFARMLQAMEEEEEMKLEQQRQLQLAEDERLAAEYAMNQNGGGDFSNALQVTPSAGQADLYQAIDDDDQMLADEEFARKLMEEDRLREEEDARLARELSERLALEDATRINEQETSRSTSPEAEREEQMRIIMVAKQADEEELAKRMLIESEDAKLAHQLSSNESALAARLLSEFPTFEREEDESLALARRLEHENHLPPLLFENDSDSLKLAEELNRAEHGWDDSFADDESVRLAMQLQEEYNNGSPATASQLESEQDPHAQYAMVLQQMHPASTFEECMYALEQSQYDLNRASEFIGQFPKLGATSAVVTTKQSQEIGYYAGSNMAGTSTRRPTNNAYSVETTYTALLDKYGSRIPPAAIRQASEQANGVTEQAETILFKKYPQEITYMEMHRKSSVQNQTSAYLGSVSISSAKKNNPLIRVTKVGGMSLHGSGPSGHDKSLVREAAQMTARPNDRREEEAGRQIDSHYMSLIQRDYNVNDLIQACQRFGTLYSGRMDKTGHSSSKFSIQREHDAIYDALHSREMDLKNQLAETFSRRGIANQQQRYHEARDWQAKTERIKFKLMAAKQEAADCLFVHKNPALVRRVLESPPSDNGSSEAIGVTRQDHDKELSVDLHTLHVNDAVDRCLALLILSSVKGWRCLKIITGKGIHSTGDAKIKPKIEELLRNSSRSFVQSFQDGNGYFLVKVKPSHL